MAIPIVLPDLGSEGETVRVSCWLVDLGDAVQDDDRVVEVLLRGMTFDVTAPEAGMLTSIEKSIDDELTTGDILGWIESGLEQQDEEPA